MQTVGLASGPKEHKLDIHEHEGEVSPREGGKAEMPFKETYTTPQHLAEEELPRPHPREEEEGAFEGAELVEAPPPTTMNPSSVEEESPVTPPPSLQEEPSRHGEEEPLRQQGQPAALQPQKEEKSSRSIGVQKLLKPQEVEVGMEKPQYSTSTELPAEISTPPTEAGAAAGQHAAGTSVPPTPATSLEPIPEKQQISSRATTTPQTPTLSTATPASYGQRGYRREDPTAKVIKDMESRGFKHVSGDEAATAAQFYEQEQQQQQGKKKSFENPLFEKTSTGEGKEESYPIEPTQGERVKVTRFVPSPGGASTIVTTSTTSTPISSRFVSTISETGHHPDFLKKGGISAGGIQEVNVRPHQEATPMGGGAVAGVKAKEHAAIAEAAGRKAAEKHKELLQLRRQAEELEQQSAALMEEAEAERKRIELAQEKLEEIEQGEWRGYAQAERAEQQRRAVVARAKPAVRTAESREREAMVQKQLAADAHFHAQVLENRARALLKESQDMAALSLKLSTEAARTNSKF
jgi:hypothetical protein